MVGGCGAACCFGQNRSTDGWSRNREFIDVSEYTEQQKMISETLEALPE
jgi:hypothetical protein